ncbi:hypothetical protein EDC48_103140 [Gibbsiella quercinecans]|uniref:hypothetical protein n=1 Tax=Gibbsiella quercinecans TaxID=929813 RepID=UPI0010DBC131|nr:hypothetical protein [Gibbsiella quercinecans]TCT90951.1 hypothetical protein EDC48_103140 [Gibbsiella quercinecans]
MINRFTLIAITAALTLTGCAKITAATSAAKSSVSAVLTPAEAKIVDFSTGPTLVSVTHVATPADDGEPIYVTVDGIDAGILAIGQTVELHVSEGKHKIGGYARSLVGRVTIPAVEVTTEPHTKQHVNYAITRKTPKFTVGPSTKVIVSAPVAAATAPAATPAATTTPSTTTAPAVTTTPETTSTPAATTPTTTTTPATTSTPTTTSVPETTTPAATTTTE